MDSTAPQPPRDGKPSTILGWVSIGLGVWGLTFAVRVWSFLSEMDEVNPSTGQPWFLPVSGISIIPLIRTFVAVGVLQMIVGGVGLLRLRPWGVRVSALAGIAWAVSSAAIFLYFFDALREAGFSFAPSATVPYRGLWWRIVSGALLVLLFSIVLTTYCLRLRATRRSPLRTVVLLLWSLLCAGINLAWFQWFVRSH